MAALSLMKLICVTCIAELSEHEGMKMKYLTRGVQEENQRSVFAQNNLISQSVAPRIIIRVLFKSTAVHIYIQIGK